MLQQDGLWSLWSLFPIVVLLPGLVLLALLASNIQFFTSIGVKLAGPRVHLRFADVQLSTLMVALCILCAIPAYASIGKFEDRAREAAISHHHGGATMLNYHLKQAFYESRNFFMSS